MAAAPASSAEASITTRAFTSRSSSAAFDEFGQAARHGQFVGIVIIIVLIRDKPLAAMIQRRASNRKGTQNLSRRIHRVGDTEPPRAMPQHNIFHPHGVRSRMNATLKRRKDLIQPYAIGGGQMREKDARVNPPLLRGVYQMLLRASGDVSPASCATPKLSDASHGIRATESHPSRAKTNQSCVRGLTSPADVDTLFRLLCAQIGNTGLR